MTHAMHQQAVVKRLQRRRGMSPEKREALRAYNATQPFHGRCRQCGTTWTGLGRDVPTVCSACGLGGHDG